MKKIRRSSKWPSRQPRRLKSRQYTVAHGLLQQLISLPNLTQEQRDLISGSVITVAENLQKAAESGNVQAQQHLQRQTIVK